MAETTIYDLALEVCAHLFAICVPRDLEALGATCHTMRAAARDPHLWRHLFERDFGHLYPTRTGHAQWPADGVLCDSWVDALCREWGIGAPTVRLPPPGEPWVPQPFMHMQSAGKDARWLYIFHATGNHDGTAARSTPARRHDNRYTVKFIEFPSWWYEEADCGIFVWKVAVGDYKITCSNTPDRAPPSRVEIDRTHESTYWTVGDAVKPLSSFRIWGPQTRRARQSLVRNGRLMISEATYRERDEYSDGSMTDHTYSTEDISCSVTRYPNGDCIRYQLTAGRVSRIDDFVCSKDCPVVEFAGRSLRPRGWTWSKATLSPDDTNEHYFWPKGTCDDALAFRDYVLRGLIGWHPRLREIALAHTTRPRTFR
ncbi:F-box domain containing protein [Pandoravirus salinus]|uniref:F-box domain containing protein n=1 Tax=Pandoravirus salinus TaxID=1349410 RepID=S4VYH3_9VIRU|nr:F-box domain [Pandoravirus salinus]AGO85749.1 F-box domain containing protein [Pandoravirus salinus]